MSADATNPYQPSHVIDASKRDSLLLVLAARKRFVAALLLAVVAVWLQVTSLTLGRQAHSLNARAVRRVDAEPVLMERQAYVQFDRSRLMWSLGFIAIVLSVVTWVLSVQSRERAWHLITAGVWGMYVLLQLVLG